MQILTPITLPLRHGPTAFSNALKAGSQLLRWHSVWVARKTGCEFTRPSRLTCSVTLVAHIMCECLEYPVWVLKAPQNLPHATKYTEGRSSRVLGEINPTQEHHIWTSRVWHSRRSLASPLANTGRPTWLSRTMFVCSTRKRECWMERRERE